MHARYRVNLVGRSGPGSTLYSLNIHTLGGITYIAIRVLCSLFIICTLHILTIAYFLTHLLSYNRHNYPDAKRLYNPNFDCLFVC